MKLTFPKTRRINWISGFLLLFLVVISCQCSSAGESNPPNILFIAVDDLKPMLNCYGESQIISPNIDKLANKGIVFQRNYCQQAVCGPTRASLLTGLRPDHTGVRDLKTRMRDVNPDVLSLPQYFKSNGYITVAYGKVYDPRCVDNTYDSISWSLPYIENNDLPLPEGIEAPMFSHYQSEENRMQGEIYLAEAKELGLSGWEQSSYGLERFKPVVESADVPDNAYYDGIMIDEAINSLHKLALNSKPFFLAVGLKKPHLPFVSPSRYWDLYDREEISLAPFADHSRNGPELAYHNSSEIRSYTGFEFINERIPEDQQREIIHGYYAAVSYIDALIGKLLENLKELGLEENTVIVLWGDHGWHLGDHSLWCKHSNFEQATRSPLIISAPGMPGGLKTNSPTEFIDVFPTLCELTGLKIPDGLDGVSLKPLIEGQNIKVKQYAISQFERGKSTMGYTLRTERYRYTEWRGNGYLSTKKFDPENVVARELYDYQDDPYETINFVDDPAYKEIADKLKNEMEAFLKSQEKVQL